MLLDEKFNLAEKLFELYDAPVMQFDFVDGRLFVVGANILRVIDIKSREETNYYSDGIIAHFSVNKSGKYVFVSNGFIGHLLSSKLEKLSSFENSNQMAFLTSAFYDDSKLLVSANAKVSIYEL